FFCKAEDGIRVRNVTGVQTCALPSFREHIGGHGAGLPAAIEAVRAGTVFTTHTPVPAGIDRFDINLVRNYFSGSAQVPGVDVDAILALGAENYEGGDPGVFNMAVMGLRMAKRANGVSKLHGEV